MTLRTPSGTAFEVSGQGSPAVVMVHGLGLDRQSWRWQVAALARDYRVVTFDLFGHGESAEPPTTPSLDLFSRQILELLDHLRIGKAAVLGFSLGGMIARRFAMDHGERLWALGVLNSAHTRTKTAQDAVQARVREVEAKGPAATAEAALQRWFTESFRAANPELMDQVRQWLMANRKEVYAPIYQVLVDGVAELVAPNPPIAKPTLVMTADEDYGNSPAMSRAIANEIPESQLIVLEGLRHMALAEAPHLFNEKLLAFLGTVRPDA
jgi:pimeloyl-ACP methyl ester carboxylesterase